MILEKSNNDGNIDQHNIWMNTLVKPLMAVSGIAAAGGLLHMFNQVGGLDISDPIFFIEAGSALMAGGLAAGAVGSVGEYLSAKYSGFTRSYLDLKEATQDQLASFFGTNDPTEIQKQIALQVAEQAEEDALASQTIATSAIALSI